MRESAELARRAEENARRAEELARQARAQGDADTARRADQIAAAERAHATGAREAGDVLSNTSAQLRQAAQDLERARRDAEAARQQAAQQAALNVPATHGGSGAVPVRPTPAHRATPSTQGPVTADNVRAAQTLLVAQASGRGTRDVIRAGQQGMGMDSRDADGVWGPRTVSRIAYVLGSAGERALPARSPRQRAARQLAVYVASGGHDAARVRQFQAALGVAQTGTLDQPTAAVVRQELSQ